VGAGVLKYGKNAVGEKRQKDTFCAGLDYIDLAIEKVARATFNFSWFWI
jgi:hypothetical protein